MSGKEWQKIHKTSARLKVLWLEIQEGSKLKGQITDELKSISKGLSDWNRESTNWWEFRYLEYENLDMTYHLTQPDEKADCCGRERPFSPPAMITLLPLLLSDVWQWWHQWVRSACDLTKNPPVPKEKEEFCQIWLRDLTQEIQLRHAARDKGRVPGLAFSVMPYSWTELN